MTTTHDMSRYTAQPIAMKSILCDSVFNCRGRIDSADCKELAASIQVNGLEFPIHLQPYTVTGKPDIQYRIISGHRRFTACRLLNWTTIPAVVRTDIVSEDQAKDLNIIENIQRQDLNIVQEAKALSYYVLAGHTANAIAVRLGKSPMWVEIRRRLLHLPKFVQDAAETGIINQNHISQIWKYKNNPEKISEIIRRIKEQSQKNEKLGRIKEDADIKELVRVRKPRPHEIHDFMFVVADSLTNQFPDGAECFAHKVLAWVNGYISASQAYQALEQECEEQGTEYRPPADIAKAMKNVAKTTA